MSAIEPTMNETYLRYAELLLQQHRLLLEGEEAEAIEEEMTLLWEHLDEVQRKSLSGLGSDPGWVRRGGSPAPRGRRLEDVSPQDMQALAAAQNNADWHGMLHQLRLCAPQVSLSRLAELRGMAWERLGQPHIAGVFHDFAAELVNAEAS